MRLTPVIGAPMNEPVNFPSSTRPPRIIVLTIVPSDSVGAPGANHDLSFAFHVPTMPASSLCTGPGCGVLHHLGHHRVMRGIGRGRGLRGALVVESARAARHGQERGDAGQRDERTPCVIRGHRELLREGNGHEWGAADIRPRAGRG